MPVVHRFVDAGFVGVCSLVGADEGLLLHDPTPVRLRLSRNLSSADATVGEKVDFEVLDEVKIGDTLVIGRSGSATATVTKAEPKIRMARGGLSIDNVRLVNADKVALRGVKKPSGPGHTGGVRGRRVATAAIVFFPAARFLRFIHRKDITIPKGTEITAYTNSEIRLDPTKFVPAEATASRSRLQADCPLGPKITRANILRPKRRSNRCQIKASGPDYNLGADDLLELKKASISDGSPLAPRLDGHHVSAG